MITNQLFVYTEALGDIQVYVNPAMASDSSYIIQNYHLPTSIRRAQITIVAAFVQ